MMGSSPRIAALCLYELPLEAAGGRAADPDALAAVREEVRGRMALVAVSRAALRAGVRPGMTEAEGRAAAAALEVRDRDPARELVLLERAAEVLFAYGPDVEVSPPAVLYVELGRSRAALERTHGPRKEDALLLRIVADLAAMGHAATAALADDPDTARTFAAHRVQERRRAARAAGAAPLGAGDDRPPAGTEDDRRRVKAGVARRRRQPEPEPSAERPEEPPPIRVVSPGRSRAALGALPVEALAWTERRDDPEGRLRLGLVNVCDAVQGLGLRTVEALRRMTTAELGARFGPPGRLLATRARAERARPLRRFAPPETIEDGFELDAVTEDLEPILFVLKAVLDRLALRLAARQRAAGALTLEWEVEPGLDRAIDVDARREARSRRRVRTELRLARPTRSAETFFALIREKLGGALPGAALSARVVAEQPEIDRGAQLDLFSRRARRTEAFAELVGRLQAALGDEAVFAPVLEDTHRPERAWSARPFDVEAALAPKAPPPRPRTAGFVPRVVADDRGTGEALPEVDPQLSVIGAHGARPPAAPALPDASVWPKPSPRRIEDEPPPPLPPRPLELLDPPEPARFGRDGAELRWRGRTLRVEGTSLPEHFRTEWWASRRSERLERDYLRVDTEDGRALWVFTDAEGRTFVHGLFD